MSVPNGTVDFRLVQETFAQSLREQDKAAKCLDIEPRRIKVYQELFYNSIEGILSSSFPVLKKIIQQNQWDQLVKDFLLNHRAQTPYFPQLGQEFVLFLQTADLTQLEKYPFILELAHYEYMEVVVDTADVEVPDAQESCSELLSTQLLCSPSLVLLSYHYPVHQLSPTFLPRQPLNEPCHLVVFRSRDDQVHFVELSQGSACILQALQQKRQGGLSLLCGVAATLGQELDDRFIEAGRVLLEGWQKQEILFVAT